MYFTNRRSLNRIERSLNAVVHALTVLLEMEADNMKTWAELKTDVAEYKDATQGLMAVFEKIRQDLAALVQSSKDGEFVPVEEITALAEDLDKNTTGVIEATLEGTPAEPTNDETHAAGM